VVVVVLSPAAQREFDALPKSIKPRVLEVFRRLGQWPNLSGVKWLRGEWAGYARVRVGDWRVLFAFVQPNVMVVRIRNRREVYED
jgi:mRNA-degrading endonuclease RelE of RelBE toxin-antitoxin system